MSNGIKNIEENNADPRLHNLNSVSVLQDAIELAKRQLVSGAGQATDTAQVSGLILTGAS